MPFRGQKELSGCSTIHLSSRFSADWTAPRAAQRAQEEILRLDNTSAVSGIRLTKRHDLDWPSKQGLALQFKLQKPSGLHCSWADLHDDTVEVE